MTTEVEEFLNTNGIDMVKIFAAQGLVKLVALRGMSIQDFEAMGCTSIAAARIFKLVEAHFNTSKDSKDSSKQQILILQHQIEIMNMQHENKVPAGDFVGLMCIK